MTIAKLIAALFRFLSSSLTSHSETPATARIDGPKAADSFIRRATKMVKAINAGQLWALAADDKVNLDRCFQGLYNAAIELQALLAPSDLIALYTQMCYVAQSASMAGHVAECEARIVWQEAREARILESIDRESGRKRLGLEN